MKANLKLERIGGDYMGIPPQLIMTCKVMKACGEDVLGDFPKCRDWVAEIVGFDSRYKFQRVFLRGKPDYAQANSVGSRGVWVNYILESGHIYDIKAPQSWKHSYRYYAEVTDDGEIVEIEEGRVFECLRNRLALMSVPPPETE